MTQDGGKVVSMRGKRPAGNVKMLLKWAQRRPADTAGSYVLQTNGLHNDTIVQQWESSARDEGDGWAQEVLDLAQQDTESRETMTEYRLVYVDHEGDELSAYRIRCRPKGRAEEIDSGSLESALKMQMKHNEAMMRTILSMAGSTAATQSQIIEMMAKRLEVLESTRTEALQLEKDALMASVEMESKEQEHAIALMREGRWLRFAKLAAMHMAKKDPDNAELVKLANTILTEPAPKLPNGE